MRLPTSVFGIVFVAFWVLSLLLGPYCFAYDLNHLLPYVVNHPVQVSMWSLPVFIGGILLGEIAVPLAVVLWIAVSLGIIA